MSRKDLEAANVLPAGKGATRVPKDKQTLHAGMPGYVKTGQNVHGRDSIRGGKGFGPHREGPIGEHGSGSTHAEVYHNKHTGSMVKSYKAESTGKPGHYHEPGPTNPASEPHKGIAPIGGHPGRMEKVIGKGKTHAEGRRKTQMY